MKKKIGIIVAAFVLLPLLVVVFTNIEVRSYAEGKTYSSLAQIPKNKVGLILGTSKYQVGGGINPYFKYRIEATVRLFNAGKIDYILVSGDNGKRYYNEPHDIKVALLKRGIPLDKIVLDYAGFRTLDSVVRAKLVFGQDSITIISQKFHNIRAIYLAVKHGMHPIAYNAQDPADGLAVHLREYLAKTKAYFDVLFDVQPKYLGKPIHIGIKKDSLEQAYPDIDSLEI